MVKSVVHRDTASIYHFKDDFIALLIASVVVPDLIAFVSLENRIGIFLTKFDFVRCHSFASFGGSGSGIQ